MKSLIIKLGLLLRSWRTCSSLLPSMYWLIVWRMWICFTSMWLLDTGWVLKGHLFNLDIWPGSLHCRHDCVGLHYFLSWHSCCFFFCFFFFSLSHSKDTVEVMLNKSFPAWVLFFICIEEENKNHMKNKVKCPRPWIRGGTVSFQDYLQWGHRHPTTQLREIHLPYRCK